MTKVPDGGKMMVESGEGVSLPGQREDDEPIELLVQLAEEGEIDPWDIDIVTVTDKFLDRLDNSDLRNSARALFYASVLLRTKSDVLLEPPEPEEPVESEPWEDWDAPRSESFDGEDPIASLEGELDRRLERKRARGKPETLDELVRELRDAERESWWKNSRSYDTSGSPRGYHRGTQTLDYHADDEFRQQDEPTEDDVTGTAHNEDIEATIRTVQDALSEQFDNGRKEVLFREIDMAGGSRVESFLAVLFLSHRGFVELKQESLFGDLWIIAV